MTRPRNRWHQNWRPRRGGGDEDEVVGGEDDKRIPGPSLYTQNKSRSARCVWGSLGGDIIIRPSAQDWDDIRAVKFLPISVIINLPSLAHLNEFRSMLNRLLDLILCGDCVPCDGTMCARWLDGVPPVSDDQRPSCERPPPVPAYVRYPSQGQPDNVSALYETSLPPSRSELRHSKSPDDLDLSVEQQSSDWEREGYTSGGGGGGGCTSGGGDTDASSSSLHFMAGTDQQFFDELYYTPLRRQPSDHYQFDDGDGSSYSTHHNNFIGSWKRDVTDDVTRPTHHPTLVRLTHTPSGTQVSV